MLFIIVFCILSFCVPAAAQTQAFMPPQWWFGGFGGTMLGGELGMVRVPLWVNRSLPLTELRPNGFFTTSGGHIGLIVDWTPPNTVWSATVRTSFEMRTGGFGIDVQENDLREPLHGIQAKSGLEQLVLTPLVRYRVSDAPVLYAFAGADVGIPLAHRMALSDLIDAPGNPIVFRNNIAFPVNSFQVAFQCGVQWDADERTWISTEEHETGTTFQAVMMRLAPYCAVSYVPSISVTNGSTWAFVGIRAGISVVFAEQQMFVMPSPAPNYEQLRVRYPLVFQRSFTLPEPAFLRELRQSGVLGTVPLPRQTEEEKK